MTSNVARVGARSERGLRDENQDRMTRFVSPFGETLAVADGMGGQRGGAVAAQLVTSVLADALSGMDPALPPGEALKGALTAANRAVFDRGRASGGELTGMGSTVVVALLAYSGAGPMLYVAHVGDSRAYLLRNGSVRQLTRDHSVLQERLKLGVDESVAAAQPDSGHLTRAIGGEPAVHVDVAEPAAVLPGDRLVLCSDGLTGFVDSARLHSLLLQPAAPEELANVLIEEALRAGSDDNITVQVADLVAPGHSATLSADRASTAARPSGQNPARGRMRWPTLTLAAVSVLSIGALYRYALAHDPAPDRGAPTVAQPDSAAQVLPEERAGAAAPTTRSSTRTDRPSTPTRERPEKGVSAPPGGTPTVRDSAYEPARPAGRADTAPERGTVKEEAYTPPRRAAEPPPKAPPAPPQPASTAVPAAQPVEKALPPPAAQAVPLPRIGMACRKACDQPIEQEVRVALASLVGESNLLVSTEAQRRGWRLLVRGGSPFELVVPNRKPGPDDGLDRVTVRLTEILKRHGMPDAERRRWVVRGKPLPRIGKDTADLSAVVVFRQDR